MKRKRAGKLLTYNRRNTKTHRASFCMHVHIVNRVSIPHHWTARSITAINIRYKSSGVGDRDSGLGSRQTAGKDGAAHGVQVLLTGGAAGGAGIFLHLLPLPRQHQLFRHPLRLPPGRLQSVSHRNRYRPFRGAPQKRLASRASDTRNPHGP